MLHTIYVVVVTLFMCKISNKWYTEEKEKTCYWPKVYPNKGLFLISQGFSKFLKVSQSSSIPLILRGSRGVLEPIPAVIG